MPIRKDNFRVKVNIHCKVKVFRSTTATKIKQLLNYSGAPATANDSTCNNGGGGPHDILLAKI